MPTGDRSFQIIEKINDSVYKVELPSRYGISSIFNVGVFMVWFGSV